MKHPEFPTDLGNGYGATFDAALEDVLKFRHEHGFREYVYVVSHGALLKDGKVQHHVVVDKFRPR